MRREMRIRIATGVLTIGPGDLTVERVKMPRTIRIRY